MSTLELSKTFAIRQKTAWLFKRKLQMAMYDGGFKDWNNVSEQLDIEISGHQLSESRTEISDFHEGCISIARKKSTPITATCIIKDKININSITLENSRKLLFRFRKKSVKNHSKPPGIEKSTQVIKPIGDIIIANLKNWLKGIHHHCSLRFVQGYLDEFFFRFNFRRQLKTVWHQILIRLISRPPYFYKPNEL